LGHALACCFDVARVTTQAELSACHCSLGLIAAQLYMADKDCAGSQPSAMAKQRVRLCGTRHIKAASSDGPKPASMVCWSALNY